MKGKNGPAWKVKCFTQYLIVQTVAFIVCFTPNEFAGILGTLFVVFSLLHLVIVLGVVIFFGEFLPVIVDDQEALLVLSIVKYAIIAITTVIAIPALIAGIGMLYKQTWALTLAFVIGIISLPAFPIWTFIGIYTIVIFIMAQRQPNKITAESVATPTAGQTDQPTKK